MIHVLNKGKELKNFAPMGGASENRKQKTKHAKPCSLLIASSLLGLLNPLNSVMPSTGKKMTGAKTLKKTKRIYGFSLLLQCD
ncbi:hypothetical protein XF_1852 [Xylella fastidiosa 9a5c]|uniref:Uncharacterized protein n=1 Tax=Xylella fastidiosa (strain 9a5c) TaxID=160492 RepID=Q9PCC9_XYLFA|nr:hypothetical protein XF_1852 [Xylella fastidiosa 9a5c]NRP54153.1 hypothetical protein [Xylella fastidiosa]